METTTATGAKDKLGWMLAALPVLVVLAFFLGTMMGGGAKADGEGAAPGAQVPGQPAAPPTQAAPGQAAPGQAAPAPRPPQPPMPVLADEVKTIPSSLFTEGPSDAAVVISEFSDFQCPYCSQCATDMHTLRKEFPNDVRVEFHHFPLAMHKDALPAARAAVAAGMQGQFWPMHDILFKNAKGLNEGLYQRVAGDLGMDVAAFMEALRSPEVVAEVQADMDLGKSLGVTGTPSLFLNGRRINKRKLEDLRPVIQEEIARVKAERTKNPKGKTRGRFELPCRYSQPAASTRVASPLISAR